MYIFLTAKSTDSVHLGSSIKIFDEPVSITKKLMFIDGVSKNNNVSPNVEKDTLLEKDADNCSIKENNNDW